MTQQLLKNAHLLRYPHSFPCPARDRLVASRSSLRGSLFGISGALHLAVIEQPEPQVLFTNLLEDQG
jgi:hypothetical protein